MAQVKIVHGAVVNIPTADEIVKLLPRPLRKTRMRMPASLALNAAGAGAVDVYKVPVGAEFEARRVVFTLTGSAPNDPNTGNVALNVAGKWIAYLRGGNLIEYAAPLYGAAVQVPGSQSWGDEQGPYLRNGEVFSIQAAGLTANVVLNIYLEGILTENDPNA